MINKSRGMSPIGIEIDQRRISAVQLQWRDGQWSPAAAAILPRLSDEWPPEPMEIERLGDCLARQGFIGRRIALAIPNSMLLTGVLDAPPINCGAPIEQIARLELARIHKRDPEQLELRWWELPSRHRGGSSVDTRSSTNIMAAACDLEKVVPLLEAFEQQHWEVEQLGVSSWALFNACATLLDDAHDIAFLDFNWSDSTVALLHRGVVVYQRTFEEAGLARLHEAITQARGCSSEVADVLLGQILGTTEGDLATMRDWSNRRAAQANHVILEHMHHIMQEVRASCSYLRHRFADASPGLLMVTGPGARAPGVLEILSRELDMKVQPADPIACLNAANAPPHDEPTPGIWNHPALVVAMGMAMEPLDSSANDQASEFGQASSNQSHLPRRLNLVPRARRLARHRRRRSGLWITVITAYAILMATAIFGSRVLHVFDSRAIASQLDLLQAQIEKSSEDAKALRMQLKQVRDVWETANVVNSQPDWSLLLALLAQSADNQIAINSCDLTRNGDDQSNMSPATRLTGASGKPSKWLLTLAGRARSQSAVSQFVLRLEQLTIFDHVRLIETRREPTGETRGGSDDQFTFLITCTMN